MAKAHPPFPHRMRLGGAWAMAVGGMIGGGIFSTLGVVIAAAGQWAWLSFAIGGVIALASGHSYAALTRQLDQPGGSYAYLRSLGWYRTARWTVWTLIVGYVFTMSVYAVTFGAYANYAIGGPAWGGTFAGLAAIIILAGVNLLGAAEATLLEKVAVWGKLAILLGLSAIGLSQWDSAQLIVDPARPTGFLGAVVGMGIVFMAYEGFQLLSYDYGELEDRKRTISIAMPAAIITTAITYVLVALGATMLAGAAQIVELKEVALAVAGREAIGLFGFFAVTLAAVFSAGSAINATVFATARLAMQAADDGELPALFAKRDESGVPWLGTVLISFGACLLILIGGLEVLVEGASFIFLVVFAIVNAIAWHRKINHRWIALVGLAGSAFGSVILILYLTGVV